MENSEYCEKKLKDIIEPLFFNLIVNRPKDIVNFSIDWLMKLGQLTSSGLTIEEKEELNGLRKEIKTYRDIEAEHNKLNHNVHDVELSDEDDEDSHDGSEANEETTVNIRGPRIAVSAEVYGQFNKKGDFKPIIHPKTEDQVTSIKARIIQSFLFNSLEAADLKIVIDAMEEKIFQKGDVVITQGDRGDCLFVVEHGDLDCFKKFSNGEEKLVKKYSEGDAFGELALLYNCPRAAGVVAAGNTTLWKLDRETFNAIVKEAAV